MQRAGDWMTGSGHGANPQLGKNSLNGFRSVSEFGRVTPNYGGEFFARFRTLLRCELAVRQRSESVVASRGKDGQTL